MKRSNVIVALGLAVFVVGAVATYLVVNKDDSEASKPSAGEANVLYASQSIPAGTTGVAAVQQGMVKSKTVAATARPSSAYSDPSELVGKTAVAAVAEGSVLTSDQFPKSSTKIGTLTIPEGKTALALKMGHLNGLAGFVQAGDRVDIFGSIKRPPCNCPKEEQSRLVLQNIEVLNVSAPTVAPGQPADASSVFVVAVTPAEAEGLVYLTTFQDLYFSLVPREQAPVPPTPGAGLPPNIAS